MVSVADVEHDAILIPALGKNKVLLPARSGTRPSGALTRT
jgi:hypothetical protein